MSCPAWAVRSCTDRLRRSVPISWGHSVFSPWSAGTAFCSVAHALPRQRVRMDGYVHSFEGGLGYVEKDSGTSFFPRSYLWMQCNDFPSACSIMISIAHIPFCGSSFRGCICAIVYQGREYRLATYRGVKVQAFTPEHICLSQGSLLLELDITSPHTGGPPSSCATVRKDVQHHSGKL